jgi:threonine aldolase
MKIIDLRSDTVTLPTDEMLEAIRCADLGDDARGHEDPTVNKLEEIAAEKMNKESALLVTSGTQGNLVSLLTHTHRGDEVILESMSHTYNSELGGLSALGGLLPRPVKGVMGALDPRGVEEVIRPRTTLICMENTHEKAGGTVITPRQTKAISDIAKAHGLKLHLDGARIFNAAVALDMNVKRLAENVDTVMFCLSKGLSAPIGSLVVGPIEFIEKARYFRTMLGGSMRQAGIIAAAGIVALEKMVDRLKDDHKNARLLAEGLTSKGVSVNLDAVQTNIVRYDTRDLGIPPEKFVAELSEYGVKVQAARMVTHRGIEREDIEYTLDCIQKIVESSQKNIHVI